MNAWFSTNNNRIIEQTVICYKDEVIFTKVKNSSVGFLEGELMKSLMLYNRLNWDIYRHAT